LGLRPPGQAHKAVAYRPDGLADKLDVRLHTHLAETEDENKFCEQTHGCRPLDYLEQCGWLNQRTWLAHGIHFNAAEMKRLGKAGTTISHCACSNQLLASGCCPVCDMEEAGVRIGLGVDGSASNDKSNLMQEVRAAFLLHDVFDFSFTEVSTTLARSEAACRKLAARARLAAQPQPARSHSMPWPRTTTNGRTLIDSLPLHTSADSCTKRSFPVAAQRLGPLYPPRFDSPSFQAARPQS